MISCAYFYARDGAHFYARDGAYFYGTLNLFSLICDEGAQGEGERRPRRGAPGPTLDEDCRYEFVTPQMMGAVWTYIYNNLLKGFIYRLFPVDASVLAI